MIKLGTKSLNSALPFIAENKAKILVGLITLTFLIMFGNPVGLLKIIIFLVLLAITAAVSYWLGSMHSPIDASPAFFLMIIIAREYGFFYALIFGILGDLIPTVISGDELDVSDLMYFGLFVLVALVSGVYGGLGTVAAGLLSAAILLASAVFLNLSMGDKQAAFEAVAHAGIATVYFVLLGNIMAGIL